MSRMIDADALYEKTAEWEARALAVIEKLNRKPFEEMDTNEITEWRKWSCILNERSAFKHDVADAPTVEPQQWIPVSSGNLPEANEKDENGFTKAYLVQDARWMDVARWDGKFWIAWGYGTVLKNVVAWMPLPEPFREGGAE